MARGGKHAEAVAEAVATDGPVKRNSGRKRTLVGSVRTTGVRQHGLLGMLVGQRVAGLLHIRLRAELQLV